MRGVSVYLHVYYHKCYSSYSLCFAGEELCLGRPVDSQLLKMVQVEVAQLEESIRRLEDNDRNRVCIFCIKDK